MLSSVVACAGDTSRQQLIMLIVIVCISVMVFFIMVVFLGGKYLLDSLLDGNNAGYEEGDVCAEGCYLKNIIQRFRVLYK